MLIDEIIAKPGWLSVDTCVRLSKMHKFTLGADFAMVADQLGLVLKDDPDKISPAMCRLPYPECWIEVAQADLLSARHELPLGASLDRTSEKKRVDFLLTQTNNDGAFEAQLFSSLVGKDIWVHCPIAVHFDPQADSVITAGRYHQIRETGLTREQARSFWNGEGRYLSAVLALMNSRNACEISDVDFTRLNQQRQRKGKPLLFSYRVLSIPGRYKQQHIREDGEPSGREMRAHFVRGHFKIRKTGIFFWPAHQRGNIKLGFVHKDYKLRLPNEEAAA